MHMLPHCVFVSGCVCVREVHIKRFSYSNIRQRPQMVIQLFTGLAVNGNVPGKVVQPFIVSGYRAVVLTSQKIEL